MFAIPWDLKHILPELGKREINTKRQNVNRNRRKGKKFQNTLYLLNTKFNDTYIKMKKETERGRNWESDRPNIG